MTLNEAIGFRKEGFSPTILAGTLWLVTVCLRMDRYAHLGIPRL
jgi:hypothetical protein